MAAKEQPDKGDPKKKVHWTRRPENKAKLAKMVKRSAAAKKAIRKAAKKNGKANPGQKSKLKPHDDGADIPQDTFAYALGHIECWIETFSKSAGVSAEALAARLGSVLRSKNSR